MVLRLRSIWLRCFVATDRARSARGTYRADGDDDQMHPPPQRQKVRINIARFWAGATAEDITRIILPDLEPFFEFETSSNPQVLLYGPYTGEMPQGRFVKVFIGCENVRPIMSECDWAFGVEHENHLKHPRYMRFMRWGDDSHLIQKEKNWPEVLRSKSHFCAFLYANEIFYREAFFTALSRYKHVESPGRSMNNMPGIDPVPGKLDWNAKIEFLRDYKFVIAFENSSRPGYNTEKLTHAIEADCVPIYWGDPEIGRSFNVRRFINAHDYLPRPIQFLLRLPYAPHSIRSITKPTFLQRAARRINSVSSGLEQRVWALAGFGALIDKIIQIDHDDELYLQHLREPFPIGNKPPDRSRWISRWREIFEHSLL
jgi:alpha(1,3/1,4) fucosyltransferase